MNTRRLRRRSRTGSTRRSVSAAIWSSRSRDGRGHRSPPSRRCRRPETEPHSASMDELALELAYRYLARRDRTIAEMRSHLSGRGIDASAIETTIEILRDQRYLDDARFVRLFAQDKRQLEPWGSERIKRTLIDRGIDRDLLDAVDEGPSSTASSRSRSMPRSISVRLIRSLPHCSSWRLSCANSRTKRASSR